MKSLYADDRWVELQQEEHKEAGPIECFRFRCDSGEILYRFVLKYAGEVEGTDYYDIGSYRGAAGPYIVSVIPGEEQNLLRDFSTAFDEYCEEQHIVAEFAKLDPWDTYAKLIREWFRADYYGDYYCIEPTPDFYHDQFHSRAQKAIRKARNHGVTLCTDLNERTKKAFIDLYGNTERKYHTADYYNLESEDLERYIRILGEDITIISAMYEDRIIGSGLLAAGEEILHFLFLGSDPEYSWLQGNSFLFNEATRLAGEKQKKLLDLDGATPGSSLESFKFNFVSESGKWHYYAIKKIRNEKIYRILTERRAGSIRNERFFPIYRG